MPADYGFDHLDHTTPENTRAAAHAAAEAVRYLNHATFTTDRGGLRDPSDVDAILGDLQTFVERLPQLLSQLGAWLLAECAAGRVRSDAAPPGHAPSIEAQAVAAVRRYLAEAADDCHDGVRPALQDARQITAKLAGVPDDD